MLWGCDDDDRLPQRECRAEGRCDGGDDWYVRYWLESVPGVAEVATVGGFVKQYQVTVDPNRLASYKIPLTQVKSASYLNQCKVFGIWPAAIFRFST